MRPRLLRHLTCPIDAGPLELVAWTERTAELTAAQRERAGAQNIDPAELDHDVIDGVLVNRRRKLVYPIFHGVPRMLVFRTPLHEAFVEAHGARLARELPGYQFPDEPSAPGELDVLRSFSTEWTNYEWNKRAYWSMTPERSFDCMRFIVGIEQQSLAGRLVLEVGIGIGAFADHLAATRGCELVGVDLGHAVDAAQRAFGNNPFFHVVQASAFAPPFCGETFDFVYSFGVLHHTYSTKAAFDRVSTLPSRGGRLFVWVYSHHHEQLDFIRRTLMRVENVVRPAMWRLPVRIQTAVLSGFVPLYMGFQLGRRIRRGKDQALYGFREAMHAARDRFSPRYAHRHSEDEVKAWFNEAGYIRLVCSSERPRPAFVPRTFSVCTGVEGVRE